ncbi:PREDICTED: uncharacterized protein LOC104398869 [Chaetura pelagica]|uniref:uncharacterized protein LOC104398869 n=1 Tax=Chaetura pelagica TaxID=8897 RepID=UPI0005235575|nr:PREDICTED: uncharacterized protein LOC104398869 [Chaetura pelagica]
MGGSGRALSLGHRAGARLHGTGPPHRSAPAPRLRARCAVGPRAWGCGEQRLERAGRRKAGGSDCRAATTAGTVQKRACCPGPGTRRFQPRYARTGRAAGAGFEPVASPRFSRPRKGSLGSSHLHFPPAAHFSRSGSEGARARCRPARRKKGAEKGAEQRAAPLRGRAAKAGAAVFPVQNRESLGVAGKIRNGASSLLSPGKHKCGVGAGSPARSRSSFGCAGKQDFTWQTLPRTEMPLAKDTDFFFSLEKLPDDFISCNPLRLLWQPLRRLFQRAFPCTPGSGTLAGGLGGGAKGSRGSNGIQKSLGSGNWVCSGGPHKRETFGCKKGTGVVVPERGFLIRSLRLRCE